VGEVRVGQEARQAGRAHRPRPEVLVAIEPGAAADLRIVEMDHGQPVEADPRRDLGDQGVDPFGRSDVVAGAPQVGRVEADSDPVGRHAAGRDGLEDPLQLVEGDPDAAATTGRVLEDEEGTVRSGGRVERPGDSIGDPRDAEVEAGALVAPDVDVHEAGAVSRRHRELVREELDRPGVEVVVRPAEVDEVRGVDGDRPDPELAEAGAERLEIARGLGPPFPGRRVVGEDLERLGTDRVGALDGADQPGGEGKVGAQAAAVGERRAGRLDRRRRGVRVIGHRDQHRTGILAGWTRRRCAP